MAQVPCRHELKHYINRSDYYEISSQLRHIAKPDDVNKRERFRIRFYNGDTSFIRVAKKMKENGLCAKASTVITKEQCKRIINETLHNKYKAIVKNSRSYAQR